MKEANDATNHKEVFIRNDQFNFIKHQTRILVTGHATANDSDVLNVLGYLLLDKVLKLFPEADKDQKWLLQPFVQIKNEASAEAYLEHLKPYVQPFPSISGQQVKKMFPKAKKMKGPDFDAVDLKEISYLSWTEGPGQMYLIAKAGEALTGIEGTFSRSGKMGICHICNRHGEVGMFTAKVKGTSQEAYIRRGNYICRDSHVCNQWVDTLERLNGFMEQLQNSK